MRTINRALSELTGCIEAATVIPTLVSEVLQDERTVETDEGFSRKQKIPAVLCDGIADVDLMMMHEFGVDSDGRVMPLELLATDDTSVYDKKYVAGSRRMVEQAQMQLLRAWCGEKRKANGKFREELLAKHKERIRANEKNWQKRPETPEDIQEIVENDQQFVLGLIKMMAKKA